MDQMLAGMLYGAAGLAFLAGFVILILVLRDMAKQVFAAATTVDRAVKIFEKSADMTGAILSLTVTNRKLLVSVDAMTAAIKVFNGMVFQQPGPEQPPEPPDWGSIPSRGPNWKPPSPPFADQFASVEQAGVMSQSDEDLAEIEFQREAEARQEPTVADILGRQKPEDIRDEV